MIEYKRFIYKCISNILLNIDSDTYININSINLYNEVLNNFLKILIYTNNKFTIEMYILQTVNNYYIPTFYRKKNNCFYIFPFIETEFTKRTIQNIQRYNINIRIHIFSKLKYDRLIRFFYKKIKFELYKYIPRFLQEKKYMAKMITNINDLYSLNYNIPAETLNIMIILQYFNIACIYRNGCIILNNLERIKCDIYIPQSNLYIFVEANCSQKKINNINTVINNYNIWIITKNEYNNIINSCINLSNIILHKIPLDNIKKLAIYKYCLDMTLQQNTQLYYINNYYTISYCYNCYKPLIIRDYNNHRIQFCSEKCIYDFQYKVNTKQITLYKNRHLFINHCIYCNKMFAYIHTHNCANFCSKQCRNSYYLRNKQINNINISKHYLSGYYMDIHHYVRSSWEHNIARILQWNQLDYDYEKYRFQLSNGMIYIPDFYVYADDTFYEIKGQFTLQAKLKIKLFRKEYSDKKLIIIDGKIYKELLKQYPNINFDKHINAQFIISHLKTYIEYRHNQIFYEHWELDYKFYTNKWDDLKLKECYNINDLIQRFNLSKYRIKSLILNGLLFFTIINNQYYFYKKQIHKLKQLNYI